MFEQIFCDDVMLVYTVVVVLNIAKDAFRRQNVAGLVQLIRTLRGRHAIENIDVKSISFHFLSAQVQALCTWYIVNEISPRIFGARLAYPTASIHR